MGLIGWIVLGALAGWLAGKINGSSDSRGLIGTVILGVIGALVGGFLWNLIADSDNVIDFSVGSLIIAVVGALIVSWLYGMLTNRRA